MKRFQTVIAVIVAAVIGFLAGAIGMRMCGNSGTESPTEKNQEEAEEVEWGDMTTYYGCPNSRRVKKLNLLKSRRML